MKKTFALLLLISCLACKKKKKDDVKPQVKTIRENGADIPSQIHPTDLYIHYSVIQYTSTLQSDTTFYKYAPDYKLLEMREGNLVTTCVYNGDHMTEMMIGSPDAPASMNRITFTYNGELLHQAFWMQANGKPVSRDSVLYDNQNIIAGVREYIINPSDGITEIPLREYTYKWQGNQINEEYWAAYDKLSGHLKPAELVAEYAYAGRKNLVDLALPDNFRWRRYPYTGNTLSTQAVSAVKSIWPNTLHGNGSIYRYAFDAGNLTQQCYRYSVDSVLTAVTTTYFKRKT